MATAALELQSSPEVRLNHQVRLHPKHRMFLEEYLRTGNATKAAIRAGYSDGYKSGEYLLKVPKIREAIEIRLARVSVKSDRVLDEISKMAFSNISDFLSIGSDGMPELDFSAVNEREWAAVQEFTEDATGGDNDGERKKVMRRKLKMHSKVQSLEMLAKHLHLLDQRVEVDIGDQLAERLQRARTRTIDVSGESAAATPEYAQAVINANSSYQLVNTHTMRDDSFDGAEQHETAPAQTSTSLPPLGGGVGDIRYMENLAPGKVGDAGIIAQLEMSFEMQAEPPAEPQPPQAEPPQPQLSFPWESER